MPAARTWTRERFVAALDALLDPEHMPDHGPNGLQVEGGAEVRKVVTAVTASRAIIEAAVDRGADALVVHHGILWDHEGPARVAGFRRERLRLLLDHDLNLLAYHLPLDLHPQLGNNAALLAAVGATPDARFGDRELGFRGSLAGPQQVAAIMERLVKHTGQRPTLIGEASGPVRRVGVVSGGGQRWFEAAVAAGAELFVTGEASEWVTHVARETGVPYVWAGHHATEKGGPQRLAEHISAEMGVAAEFVDEENRV